MNLVTQVELIYVPRYRWPRRIMMKLHKINHRLFFWEKCPMCRLERRKGRKWKTLE